MKYVRIFCWLLCVVCFGYNFYVWGGIKDTLHVGNALMQDAPRESPLAATYMRDEHVPRGLRRDRRAHQLAVGGIDVQAVLAQDRDHVEPERDAQFLEDAPYLRFADLVIRLVVEIHLVDRAPGGDDQQLIHAASVSSFSSSTWCSRVRRSTSSSRSPATISGRR